MSHMRWTRSIAFRLFALVAFAFTGMPTMADPLQTPSTSAFCSVEGNSLMASLECEFGGGSAIPSRASALVDPAPIPTVSAEASSTVMARLGAGSSATALYWFQVEGPATNVQAPPLMDISLETSGSEHALGIAKISVSTNIEPFAFVGSVCDGMTVVECDLPSSLAKTIRVQALAGSRQDTVTLFAQAQAFVSRDFEQLAEALADPYIYVDPTFSNADLYHVIVSPGLGNMPMVLELAALWLFVLGLWLLRWPSRVAQVSAPVAG